MHTRQTHHTCLLFAALAVVLSVLSAVPALGQEAASKRLNSLSPGKWAVLFELAGETDQSIYEQYFDDNATLAPYGELGLMLKHMTSDKWGYRAGFMISTQLIDRRVHDSYSVELIAQGLVHTASTRQVSPYFAVGPTAGRTEAEDSTETRGGLILSVGAEYFPIRWLSLLAEYNSSLLYRSKHVKVITWEYPGDHSEEIPPHRSRSFEFSPFAIRLGLSVYW